MSDANSLCSVLISNVFGDQRFWIVDEFKCPIKLIVKNLRECKIYFAVILLFLENYLIKKYFMSFAIELLIPEFELTLLLLLSI